MSGVWGLKFRFRENLRVYGVLAGLFFKLAVLWASVLGVVQGLTAMPKAVGALCPASARNL